MQNSGLAKAMALKNAQIGSIKIKKLLPAKVQRLKGAICEYVQS